MYFFKSKTEKGDICKTYINIDTKGNTIINQLFLIDGNEDILGMVKLYSKFGKSLYVAGIAIKFSSLNHIHQIALLTVVKNKLSVEI